MIIKILSIILSVLMLTSCSNTNPTKEEPIKLSTILEENNLKRVDFEYIKNIVDNLDTKEDTLIIDARDFKQYSIGHIPSAINITEKNFDIEFFKYKNIDKNKEMVIYCNGIKCNKSLRLAIKISKMGFNNVKVYLDGVEEWFKKNTYFEITFAMAKNLYAQNEATFVNLNKTNELKVFKDNILNIDYDNIDTLKIKKEDIIVLIDRNNSKRVYKVAKKLSDNGYINIKVLNEKIDTNIEIVENNKTYTQQSKYVKAVADGIVDSEWLIGYISQNKLPKDVTLVDVRASSEYNVGHIKGAINLVYDYKDKSKSIYEALKNKNGGFIFYCSTGTRSNEVLVDIKRMNLKNSNDFFYLDANIMCDTDNECQISPNPLLDF